MRISHEAIYQALYIQGRGESPRERARNRGKSFLSDALMISDRPAEIVDRAVPRHWEVDLILGLGRSSISTQVERTMRFTMLLHLPEDHGKVGSVKNGPALAGHWAEAVRDTISKTIMDLPSHLRRSLTWDQGVEMAQHAQLRIDTGLEIYFCDPQSPLSADCCAIACRAMHGSAAAMKVQTVCFASNFPRALIPTVMALKS